MSKLLERQPRSDTFPESHRSQSSYFGNFLPNLDLNGPLQRPLREALEARTDRQGIKLHRHLVFAWARKPG